MEDLEALLVDLQNTTEVLRRGHVGRRSESKEDLEPIYVDQKRRSGEEDSPSPSSHSVAALSLHDVESLVNRYSHQRERSYDHVASTSRPSLESLFTQLEVSPREESSSRRSLNNGASYGDLRRSSSRDPLRSDSMLGTLQSDTLSSKHGVSTIPKGDCALCNKPIIGQVVIALSKMWHPEHFRCCECGDELGHRNFFERSGKAYCEDDYHKMFSPRCAVCNAAIRDVRTLPLPQLMKALLQRCVTALGKNFHLEHFACEECGRELGEEGFHEKVLTLVSCCSDRRVQNGRAYCRSDFFRLFAPKCNGCGEPIKENFITALGTTWHPSCFVCQVYCSVDVDCPVCVPCVVHVNIIVFDSFMPGGTRPDSAERWDRVPLGMTCSECIVRPCHVCVSGLQRCGRGFDGGQFFESEGEPLCEQHFHEKKGSLCSSCRAPISGRCITAMGRRFHPEHFRCSYCNRQLNKGTFKEVDERPFCHKCWENTQNGQL